MKPSERIYELAKESMEKSIDPGFYGHNPQVADFLEGILKYLDEQQANNTVSCNGEPCVH